MESACRTTRKLIAKNPVKADAFGDYEAIQAWPLITALYSGIEQGLKMLLLTTPDTTFTLKQLARDPYGHDLEKLYSELASDHRDHIELHFREHLSLHDYVPEQVAVSAESFIQHLNGGNPPKGLSWRYFLIDRAGQVPTTGLWTMSEIWHAICCCIGRISGRAGCTRLRAKLGFSFQRLSVGRPVSYEGLIADLNGWTAQHGDLLTAWIDLLVKADRQTLHRLEVSDQLRERLTQDAHDATVYLSDSDDPDEIQLLRRIQQPGKNLIWNSEVGKFQDRH